MMFTARQETRPSQHHKRMTLAAGGMFHFYHDGIADGLAVFLPFWQTAFGLSLTQVGLLVSCFEGVTGFFQMPAGFLGERWGERRMLTAGTLMTAISFMCLGFVEAAPALVLLLMAGGIGAAVQHPLSAAMIARAYADKGRRLALGTYNFSGDIGKFLFPAAAALVLPLMGWRPVCMGFGLLGLFVALLSLPALRRTRTAGSTVQSAGRSTPLTTNVWGIVNTRAFTTLSAIGFVDSAVRTALVTFLPFLLIQKGLEPHATGFALALLFVGGAAGKFLCGALAERFGVIFTIVVTEGMTALGIFMLTVFPLTGIYCWLPVLGAALNGTSSVLYGTVADYVSPHRVGRAFGLFYTLVIAAAAVSPPIMGIVSDRLGVENSIVLISWAAAGTVPLALLLHRQSLKDGRGR